MTIRKVTIKKCYVVGTKYYHRHLVHSVSFQVDLV